MQLWLNPTRDLRVRLIGERVLQNDTTRTQIRPGFAADANRNNAGPGRDWKGQSGGFAATWIE